MYSNFLLGKKHIRYNITLQLATAGTRSTEYLATSRLCVFNERARSGFLPTQSLDTVSDMSRATELSSQLTVVTYCPQVVSTISLLNLTTF